MYPKKKEEKDLNISHVNTDLEDTCQSDSTFWYQNKRLPPMWMLKIHL